MPRLTSAAVAAAVLVALGALSAAAPAFALRADIVVSAGRRSLRRRLARLGALPAARSRPPASARGAGGTAARRPLLTSLELLPLANVAKVASAAAALGLWAGREPRARELGRARRRRRRPRSTSSASTRARPRRCSTKARGSVGYFTVALTWFGYSARRGLLGARHQRRRLLQPLPRRAHGASACARWRAPSPWWPRSSLTVAAALCWEALPALPLLSAGLPGRQRRPGCGPLRVRLATARGPRRRTPASGGQTARSKSATVSTWCVCGNMSTGATRASR